MKTLLINGAHGQFVPQIFAEEFVIHGWVISEEDRVILLHGPDDDYYWDAWCTVLDTAYRISDGVKLQLFHDDNDNCLYEEE